MSRKKINKLKNLENREAVWGFIRKKKIFTLQELQEEVHLKYDSIRDYITGLVKAGYVKQIGTTESTNGLKNSVKVFELIKDVGVDAPRVRRDGTFSVLGQGRINMWRAMRILKEFSAAELSVKASTEDCTVKHSTAESYIKFLLKAGYLIRRSKGIYFFPRSSFTGPEPPMIQRIKQVWDPNLKKIMWSSDGSNNDK